ncbi:peptide deformylase [Corynebacterium mendelii]|uniref:Peptide deformylase n=1 Tax=Corynebacterium mendelii TaxID=2765362 RepID=A0A939E3R5_9CORY|nr:peptide deformylase [Corynebacterium mendelii]MBN9645136.1 peptide deformylase [Corynebacterium mendelii]
MTVRPIVIHGNPVLHNPTEPVTESPEELAELIADMYETMDLAHGVGLAANQIGVGKRLFVYDCPDVEGPDGTTKSEADITAQGGPYRRGCVINPVLETSEIPQTMPRDNGDDDEGCLSVPGETFPTGRADWARVTGLDEHGNEISIEGYGLFARCLQHETGHLDGIIYTDTLIGRHKRAAKKAIKANGWHDGPPQSWMPGVDEDPFGHDDDDSGPDSAPADGPTAIPDALRPAHGSDND